MAAPRSASHIRLAAHTLALPALVCTTLGMFGPWAWNLSLLSHFRLQYAAAVVVAVVLCLLARSRRLAMLYAGAALILITPMLLLYWPRSATAQNGDRLLVLHWNVLVSNTDHASVARYVQASNADIVFLQEVDMAWCLDVERMAPAYVIKAVEQRPDNFGIVMYVRRQPRPGMEFRDTMTFSPVGKLGLSPAIRSHVRFGGREAWVLAVHTLPPITAEDSHEQGQEFDAIADWVSRKGGPAVVVGDLNSTPWSWHFQKFLKETGMLNSQQGFGYDTTWPAGEGGLALRIGIDHLLHTPELLTVNRQLGPACGSDHRPLLVSLAWMKE